MNPHVSTVRENTLHPMRVADIGNSEDSRSQLPMQMNHCSKDGSNTLYTHTRVSQSLFPPGQGLQKPTT